MASKPRVVITGIRSIDRRLKTLPLRLQKKVVGQSMRAGMKILQGAAKAIAPVLSGATKGEVKVRAGLKRKRDRVSIDVRVEANDRTKKTSKTTGETVFYPKVVEFKYDDWLLRAFKRAGDAARRATIAALKAGIEREASR